MGNNESSSLFSQQLSRPEPAAAWQCTSTRKGEFSFSLTTADRTQTSVELIWRDFTHLCLFILADTDSPEVPAENTAYSRINLMLVQAASGKHPRFGTAFLTNLLDTYL
ncbi:hypothetical protein SRHO_G00127280 [Serrasalmus rhombeus]